MMEDSITSTDTQYKKNYEKIILTGDFNCLAEKWNDLEMQGSENIWGSKLLKLVTDNLVMHWMQGETRLRGDDKP